MHTETRNKKVSARYWLCPGQWETKRHPPVWMICLYTSRVDIVSSTCAKYKCQWLYVSRTVSCKCILAGEQLILQLAAEFYNGDLSALREHHAEITVISTVNAETFLPLRFSACRVRSGSIFWTLCDLCEAGRKRKAESAACKTPS